MHEIPWGNGMPGYTSFTCLSLADSCLLTPRTSPVNRYRRITTMLWRRPANWAFRWLISCRYFSLRRTRCLTSPSDCMATTINQDMRSLQKRCSARSTSARQWRRIPRRPYNVVPRFAIGKRILSRVAGCTDHLAAGLEIGHERQTRLDRSSCELGIHSGVPGCRTHWVRGEKASNSFTVFQGLRSSWSQSDFGKVKTVTKCTYVAAIGCSDSPTLLRYHPEC